MYGLHRLLKTSKKKKKKKKKKKRIEFFVYNISFSELFSQNFDHRDYLNSYITLGLL